MEGCVQGGEEGHMGVWQQAAHTPSTPSQSPHTHISPHIHNPAPCMLTQNLPLNQTPPTHTQVPPYISKEGSISVTLSLLCKKKNNNFA